jgi:plasmid maintenance system killer protein
VIRNFADKEAERIWGGTPSRRLPVDIQSVARRKLRMLGNACVLDDLRIPPAKTGVRVHFPKTGVKKRQKRGNRGQSALSQHYDSDVKSPP